MKADRLSRNTALGRNQESIRLLRLMPVAQGFYWVEPNAKRHGVQVVTIASREADLQVDKVGEVRCQPG